MLSMRPRWCCLLDTCEVLLDAGAQRTPFDGRSTGFGEHHEIPGRQVAVYSERFAGQPLESVAVHGALRDPARDGQAETRERAASGSREDGEVAVGGSGGVREHAAEFGWRMKTLLGCEPFPSRQQRDAKSRPVTESGARGLWRVGWRGLCGRSRWPSEHETHGCACDASCWAGTFFS
jgi:hypothetical protein